LVGDWNLVSDLLRSDLVLWVQSADGPRAVAHCRPATGSTVYYEDPVGNLLEADSGSEIPALLEGAEPIGEPIPIEREGREATGLLVPVRKDGTTLGVLAAESPLTDGIRSTNEIRQHELGVRVLRMLQAGTFPIEGAPIPPRRGAPRVGDGVVELDGGGVVRWASPNALSAFHRFGV